MLLVGVLTPHLQGVESNSAKKGVGVHTTAGGIALTRNDVGIAWFYNWTPTLYQNPPAGVPFVPMILDAKRGAAQVVADCNEAKKHGSVLLGFNEPDNTSMANMTPDAAIALWPTLQATGMRLGSPAMANGTADQPTSWLGQFMAKAASKNYRVDFICVHSYLGDYDSNPFDPVQETARLKAYLERIYAAYQKPIWLTEFAMANFWDKPTQPQEIAFINLAIPMLESLPFVERYSWFWLGAHDASDFLYPADLCDASGALTNTGRAYRDAGPAGTLAFSASSSSILEGSSGTKTKTMTVTRTGGSFGQVSVKYATANGTATLANGDYTSAAGTLTWAHGDTASKTFTVSIAGDLNPETNETVSLVLKDPTGWAVLGTTASTILTITDDDSAPAPNITAISPDSGTTAGGTTVIITGTNLSGTTGVSFGGAPATGVRVQSATSVTCVTPAHAAGAVEVVVTASGGSGTRTGGYVFVMPALPSGWTSAAVGAASPAGTAIGDGHSFTISGSGADIWNSADAFRYSSQAVSGDFDAVVQVESQTNPNGWAKAGLMVRESTDPGSRHLSCFITPGHGAAMQYRTATSGYSSHIAGPQVTAPTWLKLIRRGTSFSTYQSTDGSTWRLIGTRTVAIPTNALLGLAVTSHANGSLSTAVFSGFASAPVAAN